VYQILERNGGDRRSARREIHDFFTEFDTPNESFSHATVDVVQRALELALECGRCLTEIPAELQRRLDIYRSHTIHEIRRLIANVSPPIHPSEGIFEDDHGLKSAPQSHRDYIKEKAILDIGASEGDSAIAFAKYAKRIYSFELSPMPFERLVRIVRQMGNYTQNVVPLLAGIGETESVVYVSTTREFAVVTKAGEGIPINITTIDNFVAKTNAKVGLIKVDTEGGGLGMLRAARKTLREQMPILAMSVYHEYDELFGIPRFLKQEFPNYRFNWQMHNVHFSALSELTFWAYPGHLDAAA
jgi:FkbM family methyltransferase